ENFFGMAIDEFPRQIDGITQNASPLDRLLQSRVIFIAGNRDLPEGMFIRLRFVESLSLGTDQSSTSSDFRGSFTPQLVQSFLRQGDRDRGLRSCRRFADGRQQRLLEPG